MADKKKGANKAEAPKEEERKDKFPHEDQAEKGGVAEGADVPEDKPAEEPVGFQDRHIITDADGNEKVIRTAETAYPKQMWIEQAYELLGLPSYVVAAVLENVEKDTLNLSDVREKLGIIS